MQRYWSFFWGDRVYNCINLETNCYTFSWLIAKVLECELVIGFSWIFQLKQGCSFILYNITCWCFQDILFFQQLTKSQSIQTDQEPKPDSTSSKLEPATPIQCSPDASDAKSGDDEAPVLTPNTEATEGKSSEASCNCSEKYEKEISDLKARLERNHQDDKEKALEELSDRVSCSSYRSKSIGELGYSCLWIAEWTS